MKRLHIFKPGKFVAANGQSYEFTEAQLQDMVKAYDPALHEAPLVIGHPKQDAPAYGWAQGLAFEEGQVYADPHQVDPDFAEMVQAGRFKKRSASFYAPDDASNPVPGVWYLRHIGFLGAQPPAVKGLKAVGFAEGEGVTVEFGEWEGRTVAGLFRRLREFFIAEKGQDVADRILPAYEVDSILEEALRPPPTAPMQPEFTDPGKENLMLTKEQLEQKERELNTREAAFAEREGKSRKAQDIAFAEGLVKAGKLLPQHQVFVADFLESLSGDSVQTITVEFAEGGKPQQLPPREAFVQFLESLGSHPLFKQMIRPAGDKEPELGASFAEGLTACV